MINILRIFLICGMLLGVGAYSKQMEQDNIQILPNISSKFNGQTEQFYIKMMPRPPGNIHTVDYKDEINALKRNIEKLNKTIKIQAQIINEINADLKDFQERITTLETKWKK